MTKVRRYDIGLLKGVQKTPSGFLRIPGYATRTGVFTYRDAGGALRRELRHPDDVFMPSSLESLRNCPVTLQHPPEMLTPKNIGEYIKGYVGDRVEVEQDKVDCDFLITHEDAIEAIENGGMRETSSGYLADLLEEDGMFNGVPYTHRQKDIKYNHVALVDRGRAGPEVRLRLDSADAIMEPEMANAKKEDEVMMEKLMIGGKEVELPAECAAVIKSMMDRYDEMKAKVDEMTASKPEEEEKKGDVEVNQSGVDSKVPVEQQAPDGRDAAKKVTAADTDGAEKAKGDEEGEGSSDPVAELKAALESEKAKVDGLQAKLDEMLESKKDQEKDKMDSADLNSRIRLRSKLERQASTLLPTETVEKFDSMNDDQIRAEVIKSRHPKFDGQGKSSVYLETRFDAIVESVDTASSLNRRMGRGLLNSKRFDGEGNDPDAARMKAMQADREAWKQPLTAVRK